MLHSLWFKLENYSANAFCALGFTSFREQEEFLETNYIVFQLSQVIYLFVFPCLIYFSFWEWFPVTIISQSWTR